MLKENNIQDEFLKNLCEGSQFGSVYLISGIQLKGVFTGFDEHAIFLRSQNSSNEQMVYKHAIATIVPLSEGK
ncbi:MAG: RNA chaperone Hfq [Gammaproteobacteria bacterium]|jgi:RNA chaperone Hfq